MTLWDVGDLFEYWARVPPVNEMTGIIAQILGWKRPDAERPPVEDEFDLSQLAMMPGIEIERGGPPATVTSLDEMRERNRLKAAEMARRMAVG